MDFCAGFSKIAGMSRNLCMDLISLASQVNRRWFDNIRGWIFIVPSKSKTTSPAFKFGFLRETPFLGYLWHPRSLATEISNGDHNEFPSLDLRHRSDHEFQIITVQLPFFIVHKQWHSIMLMWCMDGREEKRFNVRRGGVSWWLLGKLNSGDFSGRKNKIKRFLENITSKCILIPSLTPLEKFPESIEHKANEPVFSFTYFPYPMFNCRRWCFCSLFPRMAVLNSLVFHFWRCLCMQLFDDDCLWILNRQREERRSERRSSMITNNWS